MARGKSLITSEIFKDHGPRLPTLSEEEIASRYNRGPSQRRALADTALVTRDAYRPSTTPRELDAILAGLEIGEHRRVTIGRIYTVDLPKAVKRYARGFNRDERETLRTEALLLLTRWESVGTANPMPLGGADAMPFRHDWLRDGDLTPGAWRAMHAALKQAARTAEIRTADIVAETETPTADRALGEIAEREADARRDAAPMPELRAELLASALELSLSGARAILYRAYGMAPADAAAAWHVSRASVPVIVSRGTAEIERRYPEATALIEALADIRHAAREIESALADDARDALTTYAASGAADARTRAETVAVEWLSVARMMSATRRALIGATRRRCVERQARLVASALPMLVAGAETRERRQASMPGASALRTVPGMHCGAGKVGR